MCDGVTDFLVANNFSVAIIGSWGRIVVDNTKFKNSLRADQFNCLCSVFQARKLDDDAVVTLTLKSGFADP